MSGSLERCALSLQLLVWLQALKHQLPLLLVHPYGGGTLLPGVWINPDEP